MKQIVVESDFEWCATAYTAFYELCKCVVGL